MVNAQGGAMRYDVFESKEFPGEWIAQAIGSDGEIYRAIFDYCDAKELAEEYAAWKNSHSLADSHAVGNQRN
jgi:hypothetical protein